MLLIQKEVRSKMKMKGAERAEKRQAPFMSFGYECAKLLTSRQPQTDRLSQSAPTYEHASLGRRVVQLLL